jgi:hypothetical protein
MRLPQQRHRPSTKSVYSALFLLVSQLPRLHSFPTTALNFLKRDEGDFPQEDPSSPAFWWKLGVSLTLVALGGIFAGLTLALLSQDEITVSTPPRNLRNTRLIYDSYKYWKRVVMKKKVCMLEKYYVC